MIGSTAVYQRPASNWFFELENDGTVLYSSPHPVRGSDFPTNSLVGRNFFEEVTGFDDVSDLRGRFHTFVKSHKPLESFSISCFNGFEPGVAKIIMTRTHEHGPSDPKDLIMLEIKMDN